MPLEEGGSTSLGRRPTQENPFFKFIVTCCRYGYSRIRPRRRNFQRSTSGWKLLCLLALLGCIIQFFVMQKLRNTKNFLLPIKASYLSENVQTPRYLLLDIDEESQPKCKQIFESSIPHSLRHNTTDKELIKLLFGDKINLAYVAHSDSNDRTSMMQGLLCSNTSNEWILLTIVEKESQEKSTGENALAIEALLDGSEEAYECVSFDFEKCSLNSLQNDYPKLFQFDHEQHIKSASTNERKSIYIETVHTVYYYIRRKAADFIRHKRQLTEIGFASLNVTMVPDLITSQRIRIKVKMTKNSTLFPNMDCVAILQEKDFSQTCPLQMANPIIQFNQLSPSTNYSICINCEGINRICKQIETSERPSFDYQSYTSDYQCYTSSSFLDSTISIKLKHVALVIIIIIVFMLICVVLSKPTTATSFCCYPIPRPPTIHPTDDQDSGTSSLDTTNSNNTNTAQVRGFQYDSSPAANTVPIPTPYSTSAQGSCNSVSSIDSTVINPP